MSNFNGAAKDTANAIGHAAGKIASGASIVASEAPPHKWAVVAALAIIGLTAVGILVAFVW